MLPNKLTLGSLTLVLWMAGNTAPYAADAVPEVCSRPQAGSAVEEPEDLHSSADVLKVDLSVRNEKQQDGSTRFCYVLGDGNQSPTLRLKPGDLLILNLENRLTDTESKSESKTAAPAGKPIHLHKKPGAAADPCTSATMRLTSANLHFHGLSIPPLCHQDDVLHTSIQPSDPPFEYRLRIPGNASPGLYWYHPHIHGFSSRQVLGGASGALIVEGIERANHDLAGLPERVLVIRDQDLVNPNSPPPAADAAIPVIIDRDGDSANNGTGAGKPAKDLSVNFVPVPYPDYPTARIEMKPGERQLWRVVNASSVTYLNLAMIFKRGSRFQAQHLGLVAIDGVPLTASGSVGHAIEWRTSLMISPGARAEFMVTGPPAGVPATLVTRSVNTGLGGENDPNRSLISILASPDAAPLPSLPASSEPPAPATQPWLGSITPVRVRKLYFSEDAVDPQDPNAAQKFYLTVDGQTPAAFDPSSTTPNIVVKQGDVEDWVIENRSTELHAFHIHQVHFQVVEWLGLPVNEPFLRDTINVPFFSAGMSHYPSVRLRMDFRDPNTVGTFLYHCHLLDHEDGGMMGLIRVDPATPSSLSAVHTTVIGP
jgi:FtsP/CotA-like multicopper oxidase with cupredoxin domain